MFCASLSVFVCSRIVEVCAPIYVELLIRNRRLKKYCVDSLFGIWLCGDKYFHCFQLTFEGIHSGVKDCLIDLLKTLHLQLHVFSSVGEAFKIIIWYDD